MAAAGRHTAFNVDRFADGSHNTPAFPAGARTPELLAKNFGRTCFPKRAASKQARGQKRSPLYDPAQGRRGVF